MAGVKGKSGGARPNSGGARPNSGGKRLGAGRKPAPPVLVPPAPAVEVEPDSIKFMRKIVNDATIDAKLRLEAAKALAPFEAVKKGETGKKDEQSDRARKASQGRFAASAPPRLVVNNRP